MKIRAILAIVGATLVTAGAMGCDSPEDQLLNRNGGGETPDGGAVDPNSVAATCAQGTALKGFGGRSLVSSRIADIPTNERARVKPFSALAGEYERVLGSKPASLDRAASTFGAPPPHWHKEPAASAISISTAFNVAFDGCLTYTATSPNYAAAPTEASAATECAAMAKKFWSRTAIPEEITACAKFATTDAKAEGATDPRRQWASVCASVLTSAGFLTY